MRRIFGLSEAAESASVSSALCHSLRKVIAVSSSLRASRSKTPFAVAVLSLVIVALIAVDATRAQQTIVRFATYNVSMTGNSTGQLDNFLSLTDPNGAFNVFGNAAEAAQVIQLVRPDVLLLNEFDYNPSSPGTALTLFQNNYLSTPQSGDAPGISYAHQYVAPMNSGLQPDDDPGIDGSRIDFNNDGQTSADGSANDAYGFGSHPGHFGMALLSQHPIVGVRTFQTFQWAAMPGARLPDDPNTPEADDWYSPDELAIFRLSSKSHWDITLDIHGEEVHVIAAHPTPPVFDSVGPNDPFAGNLVDYNGKRNADEVRLIDDYITPGDDGYIVDDDGVAGGLGANESFVIMGDLNADPDEGDGIQAAIESLLNDPRVNDTVPTHSATGDPTDTADFGLRADYVLPSSDLRVTGSGVFWPTGAEPGADSLSRTDHRLVYVDAVVIPEPSAAFLLGSLGMMLFVRRSRR